MSLLLDGVEDSPHVLIHLQTFQQRCFTERRERERDPLHTSYYLVTRQTKQRTVK